MHEHDAIPPTQSRQVHPFAYNAQRTPPFSALAGGRQTEDMGGLEGVEERGRAPKPDSEVLSRGAGMRSLSSLKMRFRAEWWAEHCTERCHSPPGIVQEPGRLAEKLVRSR